MMMQNNTKYRPNCIIVKLNLERREPVRYFRQIASMYILCGLTSQSLQPGIYSHIIKTSNSSPIVVLTD